MQLSLMLQAGVESRASQEAARFRGRSCIFVRDLSRLRKIKGKLFLLMPPAKTKWSPNRLFIFIYCDGLAQSTCAAKVSTVLLEEYENVINFSNLHS